jgi:hypothetical protein
MAKVACIYVFTNKSVRKPYIYIRADILLVWLELVK